MDKDNNPPKPPYPKNNPWEILMIGGLLLAVGITMILANKEGIMSAGGYRTAGPASLANTDTLHFIGWLSFIGGLLLTAGYFKLWNDIKKGR